MECERIKPLSEILESLFTSVGEIFNNTVFISGFQYSKILKIQCQMLHFILGQDDKQRIHLKQYKTR
jgi:small basic protein